MGKIIEKVRKQQARRWEVQKQWAMHDLMMRMPLARPVELKYHEPEPGPTTIPKRPWWRFWA